MTRWTQATASVVTLLTLGVGGVACGDDSPTTPAPSESILRYQISMDGFVILATGDTVAFNDIGGELNVAQTLDPFSTNEVDVGIFTDVAPAVGVTGLRLATNTILTGPDSVGTTGEDVADVITLGAEADVEVTLLTAVLGTSCTAPPADNIFAADSVFKIMTGRVLVSLPPGTASGSVALGGNPCDGTTTANVIFSATFTGSRLQ
ncbi:MAG: hypothetical protein ACR2QM_01390 [Longimicrobiales bacterium]